MRRVNAKVRAQLKRIQKRLPKQPNGRPANWTTVAEFCGISHRAVYAIWKDENHNSNKDTLAKIEAADGRAND